jgi:tRNA threonylcarbamoyladenosine biosynthesis protein TsaB
MIVLALDTALNMASAALWDSDAGAEIARASISQVRGHEGSLFGLVERVIAELPGGFARIDRIAVTVGPGSFTGLRIGVAAARAFGLATGAPVVGISTLAAFAAAGLRPGRQGVLVAAVDGRKGRVFAQTFGFDGRSLGDPLLIDARRFLETLDPGPLRLVGTGAPILAIEAWRTGRQAEVGEDLAGPNIGAVARLGCLADPALSQPRPIYFENAAVTVKQEGQPMARGLAVTPP